MMLWEQLLSVNRVGHVNPGKLTPDSRAQFRRDYDRLIFSSPFRRLQNKTQVFPLPGSIFVHNRLTHSLEVASVGRSLGDMVSDKLMHNGADHILISKIGTAVSAACLAHDLGNPPFGHSGEDAIKSFFTEGNGIKMKDDLSEAEWKDFTYFDGNANAFRLLSHQFKGRRLGGFALTYTMMASIVKYPYESSLATKPKFGFFQSEKEIFREIANELGIVQISELPMKYARHPLVYLVEAADDICYQIMDLEDAHKLKILNYGEIVELYMNFFNGEENASKIARIKETFEQVTDHNEQIAYLRSIVINKLINECITVFFNHYDEIMAGAFNSTLIKEVPAPTIASLKKITDISVKQIYAHPTVVQIELAGYKIIDTLLDTFIQAIFNQSGYDKKLLSIIPEQYMNNQETTYGKIQTIVDYLSGMTDVYALDLYRKITGISLPGIGQESHQ